MQAAKTPTPPPSLGKLTTIGSHQPEAWQIVTRTVREQGWHLVDIRSQPSFLAEWSAHSLRWHFGYSYHTVPEFGNLHKLDYDQPVKLAIELPVVTSKSVELFRRYGLLKPLPSAPGEQPVLLRTAKSQRILLPGLGYGVLSLSVYLWLPADQRQPEQQDACECHAPRSTRKEPRL